MENFENRPEKFPSQEEIKSVFEKLLNGKEFKELKIKTDEAGEVLLYEIEVTGEKGEKTEYLFSRAKNDYKDKSLPTPARYSASIHETYYVDDRPISGTTSANYIDGKWEYPT